MHSIALLEIGHNGQECQAIRNTLEYFGFRVIYYPIGRPKDLIAVLNGKALYPDIQDIIISAHGEQGQLIMPELATDVYEADEPKGNFTPDLIRKYSSLDEKQLVSTACTLGQSEMANALLGVGCQNYIGATDYIDGTAALLFVQHFYYQIAKGNSRKGAFEKASRIEEEIGLFRFYE